MRRDGSVHVGATDKQTHVPKSNFDLPNPESKAIPFHGLVDNFSYFDEIYL